MNEFKKGDYVVFLQSVSNNNTWEDSLPLNYVYRLSRDVNESNNYNFSFELDIQGNVGNGWSGDDKKYGARIKFRKATYNEIATYIANGNKPFHIDDTIMPNKAELRKEKESELNELKLILSKV